MNLWQCPHCGWQKEQPACVTGGRHRCNPNIPREYPLVQVQPQTPQEGKQ